MDLKGPYIHFFIFTFFLGTLVFQTQDWTIEDFLEKPAISYMTRLRIIKTYSGNWDFSHLAQFCFISET